MNHDRFWLDAAGTWIITGLLGIAYLVALGALENKDRRIAQLERAKAVCQAVRDGEMAVMTQRDGVIQCALHTGPSGNRQTHRYEVKS